MSTKASCLWLLFAIDLIGSNPNFELTAAAAVGAHHHFVASTSWFDSFQSFCIAVRKLLLANDFVFGRLFRARLVDFARLAI